MLDDELCMLDGTPNKGRLGANAILGVSLAVATAAADEMDVPLYRYVGGANAHVLPMPMLNVLNGGRHADSNVDMQEFMLAPVGAASYAEALRWGTETYHALARVLHDRGLSTAVGDEGGFAPDLPSNEDALEAAGRGHRARAGRVHEEVAIAVDVASTELYRDGTYVLDGEGTSYSSPDWVDELVALCERYPIVSIEDGDGEDDWDGWRRLTERLGARVQLVGDDSFVTNPERLRMGIERGRRELDPREGEPDRHAQRDARHGRARRRRHAYTCVMSHRSGETEDTTIADLAVATDCGMIKAGAPGTGRADREVQPAPPHRGGARPGTPPISAARRWRADNDVGRSRERRPPWLNARVRPTRSRPRRGAGARRATPSPSTHRRGRPRPRVAAVRSSRAAGPVAGIGARPRRRRRG